MGTPDLRRPLDALRQTWVPLGILILSLGGVAWWSHSLRIHHDDLVAERLTRKAAEFTLKLGERMRAYEQVLWGAAALFETKGSVTRADWHTYVERLDLRGRYPGILAIGYAQVMAQSALAAHVQSIRAQGFPDYRVRPEADRAQYTSIVFVEPFGGRNLRAFGYDMSTESVRREAMERARDSGRAAISGRVTLLQDDVRSMPGLLLYVPVYRAGARVETLEQRKAVLQGYVTSPTSRPSCCPACSARTWTPSTSTSTTRWSRRGRCCSIRRRSSTPARRRFPGMSLVCTPSAWRGGDG